MGNKNFSLYKLNKSLKKDQDQGQKDQIIHIIQEFHKNQDLKLINLLNKDAQDLDHINHHIRNALINQDQALINHQTIDLHNKKPIL